MPIRPRDGPVPVVRSSGEDRNAFAGVPFAEACPAGRACGCGQCRRVGAGTAARRTRCRSRAARGRRAGHAHAAQPRRGPAVRLGPPLRAQQPRQPRAQRRAHAVRRAGREPHQGDGRPWPRARLRRRSRAPASARRAAARGRARPRAPRAAARSARRSSPSSAALRRFTSTCTRPTIASTPPSAINKPPYQMKVTNGFHHTRNCQRPSGVWLPITA